MRIKKNQFRADLKTALLVPFNYTGSRRTNIALIVAFLCLLGHGLFADGAFDPYAGPRFNVTIGFALGLFDYTTTDDPPEYTDIDPMLDTSIELEYRFFNDTGVGAYLELRGYKWKGITSSDPLFGQIYGAPGFVAGIMGFWHFLSPASPLDISLTGGVGINVYAETAGVFPGLDLKSELQFMYQFSPAIAAGLRATLGYSSHPGGPEPDNPGTTRRPFGITDCNLGLILRMGF
jgi:hypothetical protein